MKSPKPNCLKVKQVFAHAPESLASGLLSQLCSDVQSPANSTLGSVSPELTLSSNFSSCPQTHIITMPKPEEENG